MSFTVGISKLLGLRHQHGDQAVLDLLQLAMMLNYAPGIVTTEQLQRTWQVHQSSVSRRIAAMRRQGLIDVSRSIGGYKIHGMEVL